MSKGIGLTLIIRCPEGKPNDGAVVKEIIKNALVSFREELKKYEMELDDEFHFQPLKMKGETQ